MNKSGLHPTGDMILVSPGLVDEVSEGGIVIPSMTTDKEKMAQTVGVVVEIGAEAKNHPRMQGIDVGTIVWYARYAGLSDHGIDGEMYTMMRAADVMGWREFITKRRPETAVNGFKV